MGYLYDSTLDRLTAARVGVGEPTDCGIEYLSEREAIGRMLETYVFFEMVED